MTVEPDSNLLSALDPQLYRDLLQPSAQRVGDALQVISKVGLSPIALLDWDFEQSKAWLANKIEARIAATPPQHLVPPGHSIACMALTNIAASHDQPELQELFAEMLLKALDSRSAQLVHPAYFPTLAQLSAQEALVFVGLPRLSEQNAERRQGDSVFVEVTYAYGAGAFSTIEMQFASIAKQSVCRITETSTPSGWTTFNVSRSSRSIGGPMSTSFQGTTIDLI